MVINYVDDRVSKGRLLVVRQLHSLRYVRSIVSVTSAASDALRSLYVTSVALHA